MIINTIRRALRWWWSELGKPFRSDVQEPMGWDDSSEPVEPLETNSIALPDSDWNRNAPLRPGLLAKAVDEAKHLADVANGDAELDDRALLSDDEKALFEQISPAAPEKVVAYPPKVDEQDARDWVTDELKRRTGGLTRHPADITQYPEPPTEADIAALEWANANFRYITRFSHGYSMRYLGELLSRAKRKDRSLSTEDLMALRSRGLI